MFHDYYEILGADPASTRDEIKRLYRMRARESHPDRHPDNSVSQTAEMSLINEAYKILIDPRKRSAYDIEWKRHYHMKGLARNRPADEPPHNQKSESVITQFSPSDSIPKSEHLPFWKDHRILTGFLIILLLILAVDIYFVYFRHRIRDRVPFRDTVIERTDDRNPDDRPSGFQFR